MKSILLRLRQAGQPAPRVQLRGESAPAEPKERYELLDELGRGGVGVVHRGHDADLGRDVALKLLREDFADQPELVQRFVEEAQIGGQLTHPGVVPVYELGLRDGTRPFFAMKLVKGETLAALLGRRAEPADGRRRLLGIFAQVCQTVAYAHARSVIHRDLKPSNVMVGAFGEVQVVDWGCAKVLRRGGVWDERLAQRATTLIATVRSAREGSQSIAGSVMGTPRYMPPEQALGRVDDLDERSDVFSLGAILCEILTGLPPYVDDALLAASQARLEDAHARLDACGAGPELVALAKRAMAPLPKDRPASAQELAEHVGAYLAEAETRAHRARVDAAQRQAEAERQRRARGIGLATAAVVACLILLGVGGWQRIAAERTAAEQQRRGVLEAAVREAERLAAANDFAAATVAAARARDLAARPVEHAEAEALLARFEREGRAFEETQRRRREDQALLHEIEDLRACCGDEADVDAPLLAALADRGLALDGALAERLAASHLAADFAANLDGWALRRKRTGGDGETLAALARRVDASPDALRDALHAGDPVRLRHLIEETAVADLSRAALANVIDVLDPDAALVLLKEAAELHPGDIRIQASLARACRRAGDHVAEARAWAAGVALRPHGLAARHRLGLALAKGGDAATAGAVHGAALEWLSADLVRLRSHLAEEPDEVRRALRSWKRVAAVAPIREGLDALPSADREAWGARWREVDALLAQTRG